MPKYRTKSRRWLRKNPPGSQKFTGLQDWWLGVKANPRVDNASRGHDGDFTNYDKPYTTSQAADDRWINRVGDDYSIPAVVGKAIFSAKRALLPRSKRSWDTVEVQESSATSATPSKKRRRTPEAARAPTITHGTNNRIMPKRKSYSTYTAAVPGRKRGRTGVTGLSAAEHRTLNAMKRLIKSDIKYIDQEVAAGTEVFELGSAYLATSEIPQGTGKSKRAHDFVMVKGIEGKFEFTANASASTCQNLRMMLVLDTQTNGKGFVASGKTAPEWDINDILVVGAAGQTSTAPRNLDQTGRFRILHQRKFVMDADASSGKRCKQVNFSKYFKTPIKVDYKANSSTGVIANIQDNALWVLICSDDTTVSTHGPYVRGQIRCKYMD